MFVCLLFYTVTRDEPGAGMPLQCEFHFKRLTNIGHLITLTQFFVIAVLSLPENVSMSTGSRFVHLCKRKVPLRNWLIYTAFFLTVNLLNNSAFAFDVSIPLHIIIRSAGPVVSMIVGYIFNSKRYSIIQIASVILLTLGVVSAALSDAKFRGKSLNLKLDPLHQVTPIKTLTGYTILMMAMVLSAFQGVYADRLYAMYGRNNWQEALFYSHALSIPFLILRVPHLEPILTSPSILDTLRSQGYSSQFDQYFIQCRLSNISFPSGRILLTLVTTLFAKIPTKLAFLVLNATTQYFCIRGVYLLSAKSSSLTVVVILNIRKVVSLLLSVFIFGNRLSSGTVFGAIIVLIAGIIYAFESTRSRSLSTSKATPKNKNQ